jgi:hypothetical protein
MYKTRESLIRDVSYGDGMKKILLNFIVGTLEYSGVEKHDANNIPTTEKSAKPLIIFMPSFFSSSNYATLGYF